ncbi:PP0621 family protein [Methylophaga sp. OBS4]|uniref:PP0621 family protein n=1 Tax=Methylophaga sp. OBS4 TaxID=2991935 RepID=UPI002255E3D9|nr:PP0621 family protein [Methylophaga sp. OBS4]MCX4188304.1 PP0621 family protein [Methylophaga sp. OBS4]
MRILVLLAIALLLYIIISNLLRKSGRPPLSSGSTESMVKCEHCGLHIVENEALKDNRQFFCCVEHLEAHRQSK